MKIQSKELTTCSVDKEGEVIALDFRDLSGNDMSLRLPFRQAQALAMTLPHLLTRALIARTGDKDARFVFPLGDWLLEDPKDGRNFILTLQTGDGFTVSFALAAESCGPLGGAIARAGARNAVALPADESMCRGLSRLN